MDSKRLTSYDKDAYMALLYADMSEAVYHGILLGLLGYKDTWIISSNEESGDGYSDILVRSEDEDLGIVIEVKYAEDDRLEEICRDALEQIESRRYTEELQSADL